MEPADIRETPEETIARLEDRNRQLEERLRLASKETLGIVWRDQPEDVETVMQVALPILVETPSRHILPESGDGGRPHLLLEGDNLHALTTLQYTHKEKVDVIYIDPPYNTGQAKTFAYNDRWVTADDPDYHSTWLSFINRRLWLAKDLLTPTGLALISIGIEEHHRLRMLCDRVFGEANLIADLVWEGGRKNDSRFVSSAQDYILVYAKSLPNLKTLDVMWREEKEGADRILVAGKKAWDKNKPDAEAATKALKDWYSSLPEEDPVRKHKHFSRIDDQGRVFFADNISWPGGGGPRYEVLHPVTGKPVNIPSPGWRFSKEEMENQIELGNIYFGQDETTGPNRKSYLTNVLTQVPASVFYRDRRAGSQKLNKMIGKDKFTHPKDPTILARWIGHTLTGQPGSVVLDFFAGSGSTLEAVAMLNQQDGGDRQCILVTNNEGTVDGQPTADAGEDGIAQKVTYPRLKAALTGKWADKNEHDPLPGSIRWYRTEFVERQPGRDDMLAALSSAATDLAAIRENTFERVDEKPARWTLLTSHDKQAYTLIWFAAYSTGLEEALLQIPEDAEKTVYAFNYDDTNPPWVEPLIQEGWRAEPFPTRLHAALRRHHRNAEERTTDA